MYRVSEMPLGSREGACDGSALVDGMKLGLPLGNAEGEIEGSPLGISVRFIDGVRLGVKLGVTLGSLEGNPLDSREGACNGAALIDGL